jgi:hypothetical protein
MPVVQTYFENVPLDEIRSNNIQSLLDKAVRLGGNSFTALALTAPEGGHTVSVKTTREYRDAIGKGYYAQTTFDMKMEAFFSTASVILEALSAFRPYAHSFLNYPRVGITDFDLMPSSILPYMGDNDAGHQALIEQCPTLAQLQAGNHIKILAMGSSYFKIEYNSFGIVMRELFRADVDGDGYEDILASSYIYATGGTMGFGLSPIALARRSSAGLFETTQIVPSPFFSGSQR